VNLVELFLDRSSPLHWVAVVVLLVSGAACAWIGIRDGLVRREVRTNSGNLTGTAALVAGLLYAGTGLASVAGAVLFVLRGR
jgi:hypothetical protein